MTQVPRQHQSKEKMKPLSLYARQFESKLIRMLKKVELNYVDGAWEMKMTPTNFEDGLLFSQPIEDDATAWLFFSPFLQK